MGTSLEQFGELLTDTLSDYGEQFATVTQVDSESAFDGTTLRVTYSVELYTGEQFLLSISNR